MPRGLPDYYNPALDVSQRMVDLAGIIAAQTGVSPVDGLGRPFYVDNFREGLTGWVISSAGDGANPVLDTTISYVPPVSVNGNMGTGAGGGNTQLLRNAHTQVRGKFGIEISTMRIVGASTIRVLVSHTLGGFIRTALVNVDTNTGDVILQHATGTAVIANIGTIALTNQWIVIKMVADYNTRAYERFLIGQQRYDISQYNMTQAAFANNGLLQVAITGFGNGAGTLPLRIGHVILTLDEP